ncbi:hypothetical protein [Bacillus sp. SG-1]|uniref:hypothetical protein n=1 Tax=Bacillus sp. SG-1 TaxID=161544 RepID=UPI00015433BD|nr:hypothetical protein [Bacillus sp. SG-1]EDL65636.1 hypothetical protein BSG1_12216 [Bacillus sp. SG-1]
MRYFIIFLLVLLASVSLFFPLAMFAGEIVETGVLLLILLAAFIISLLFYIIDLLKKR